MPRRRFQPEGIIQKLREAASGNFRVRQSVVVRSSMCVILWDLTASRNVERVAFSASLDGLSVGLCMFQTMNLAW